MPPGEGEWLLNAEAIRREEETSAVADGTPAAATATATAPHLPVLAERAADVCATALSESFLLAQRGLHAAKDLDGKVGLTRRLEEKGVPDKAKAAADKLSARAQEIDGRLKLSEGLRDTADRGREAAAVLSGHAAALTEQALRKSPALAQGAQQTNKMLKLAEAWGKRTLERAKEQIESRGGVLPGSTRGQEGAGAMEALGEYAPLMSSAADADAATGAAGAAAPLSPGEEEVPIQL